METHDNLPACNVKLHHPDPSTSLRAELASRYNLPADWWDKLDDASRQDAWDICLPLALERAGVEADKRLGRFRSNPFGPLLCVERCAAGRTAGW